MAEHPNPAPAVTRLADRGMLTLRCDLGNEEIRRVLTNRLGLALPDTGRIISDGDVSLAWMSPDELLLIAPLTVIPDHLAALGDALAEHASLLAETSSLRTLFQISGPDVRDVLAQETPANLSPRAFAPGDFRRTRFGQVAAALWLEAPDEARLACRTSESDYVEALLKAAATGPHVGHLA